MHGQARPVRAEALRQRGALSNQSQTVLQTDTSAGPKSGCLAGVAAPCVYYPWCSCMSRLLRTAVKKTVAKARICVCVIASKRRCGKSRSKESGAKTVSDGTQKPVRCMAEPLRSTGYNLPSSGLAGLCIEASSFQWGSGTTLIRCGGAETTGRVCYGIELGPGLRRCGSRAVAGVHWPNLRA